MKIRGVLFSLALFCAGVEAQAVIGSGTIRGTVKDYTGSGIPDTTIVITNDKLGIHRELDTTDDGGFNASALPPGDGYSVKVTRKGFLDLDQPNLELLAGHTISFEIVMAQEPSYRRSGEQQNASITFEDEIFAAVENTFSAVELDALPAAGRDPGSLVPLAPAAVENFQSGVLAFRSDSGTTAYYTDGILTSNLFFYNQPPVAPAVPLDSLAEMQVISGLAPAEFTHGKGGFVNAVTQSGGNATHGALFGYFSPNSWSAADKFGPGFHPNGSRVESGIHAGGPAGSQKLFWFASAEDLNRHTQGLNLADNPLITNPAGTAVNPANCGAPATAAQCASAIDFLNRQLNRVVSSSQTSLWGLARLDWRPNSFNNVDLEAGAIHQKAPNGTDLETVSTDNGLLGQNGTWSADTRYGKAGYTAIWSGNATNQVFGAFFHQRFSDYEDSALLPSTGALGIDIAGTPFGGNPRFPQSLSENRYQIADHLSGSIGAHSLKFGIDFDLDRDVNRQILNSAGYYYFPTLTAFAQDFTGNTAGRKDYSLLNQGFGIPLITLPTKAASVYAQDTWTPFRKLTVVLGLTWEKPFLPKPPYQNTTFFQTGTLASPDIDFSPRISGAYRLTGRTVIRAGIGTYYQPYSGQLLEALYNGNAISQLQATITPLLSSPPVFPHILGAPGSLPKGATDVLYERSKFRVPLSAQGTFGIEQHVSGGITVSLNYLYARGIGLWTYYDTNLNFPSVFKTYAIDNAAGQQVSSFVLPVYSAKTNTNFAQVDAMENSGRSSYHAGVLQYRQRMSHGLSLQASFTYSHAIDDVSGPPAVAGFVPANFSPGYYSYDRFNSAFNQPLRGTVVWTWQPRPLHNDSFAARYLVNGWTLSGAAILASGLGEIPLVVVNGQQFGGTNMVYTTSLNGSGGWSRVPFNAVQPLLNVSAPNLVVPRILPEGAEYNVDARLSRDIPISERMKATVMFEGFNVFNTQFNTSVNTIAYTATSGVLHPVPYLGLGNSAAGYPFGDNARHLQVALRIVF